MTHSLRVIVLRTKGVTPSWIITVTTLIPALPTVLFLAPEFDPLLNLVIILGD